MKNGIRTQLTRCGLTAATYRQCRPSHTLTCAASGAIRWNSSSSSAPTVPPRQWSTPLAKILGDAIEATGPISIASYMRQCLTNPDGGYYTGKRPSADADPFGTKGDFITSPEISQVFGELVGIWFMTEWMAQGRPQNGVQFIEMGPGRGTLMSDILRVIGQFKTFAAAVEAVWLVEASEALRLKQRDVLCGESVAIMEKRDDTGKNVWWEAPSKHGGITVRWVEDVVLLPQEVRDEGQQSMPFIIAHEFFDALPIHAFESVAPKPEGVNATQLLDNAGNPMVRPTAASKLPQWRELLVSPTKRKLRISNLADEEAKSRSNDAEPEFHLTLAKASTPTSLVLPERPRFQKLKPQIEARVEISPESWRYARELAKRIGHGPKGAALIIDYGPLDSIPINSLRGIRKHKITSPFAYPGQADISADVDFGALADAALEASHNVEVHGPVEQGAWLTQLGIQERAERLIRNMSEDWAGEVGMRRKELETGWKRLVEGGPRGMGKAYKVMAILPENSGKRRPVGFGGSVAA